jgi:hypothetical protein
MQCPRCGYQLEHHITERQQLALDALRAVTFRMGGRRPGTLAIAMEMGYSTRWAFQFLRDLEEIGVVSRPDGPRSGWSVVKEPHQHLALAA